MCYPHNCIPSYRKIISEDFPRQDCGSWQHTWPCTERLCWTADRCPNGYLQHLAEPGSHPHINHTGTKEITCVLSKRLLSHSTDSNHNEVARHIGSCEISCHEISSHPYPPPILTIFYRGTIESVLTSCIAVWYGNCSAANLKTLQRTVNTAAKIIGAPLPSILDIFLTRCPSKANSIVKDPTHPSCTNSGPVQTPCSNTLYSIRTRHFHTLVCMCVCGGAVVALMDRASDL